MPTKDEFRTSDIGIASYVLSADLGKYRGIDWGSQNKATFIFRPGPSKEIVADFLNGAEAPAKRLLDSLRALRTSLNEGRPSD